jgi:hypothetical protein
MKRRVNLQAAAENETLGGLAVRSGPRHRPLEASGQPCTPAQGRALSDLALSFIQAAREAGAEQRRVTIGCVSFELHDNGTEEILSIRTPAVLP